MYGTQYASGLRRICAKHERVGDWVVFDTR
jgi:hypothetical protein